MQVPPIAVLFMACIAGVTTAVGQELAAARITPNLQSNIDRPLRYRPDRGDFVIRNGREFFNRPLYGGNTAFRVDGGDKPEFVLYLPGRGGNLRIGVHSAAGTKWLNDAATIETRYRPGELRFEIRDPLLGPDAVLRLTAVAYASVEGLGLRIETERVAPGVELLWAYGGVNGQRGKRDGDIGTESVPISEWFQFKPEFARGNEITVSSADPDERGRSFQLRAKPATIRGAVSEPGAIALVDAAQWNEPAAMARIVGRAGQGSSAGAAPMGFAQPILGGLVALVDGHPLFLSLVKEPSARGNADLDVYREVTARPPTNPAAARPSDADPKTVDSSDASDNRPDVARDLAARFAEAEQHFAALRNRVSIDTPDEFLNAAVGALDVAADAVWDEPQQAIMHGAIAWRTRLLGWRGPYALDALGWHERFEQNARYWFGRQNTAPVPSVVPPADERANLARNEAGLHTNGDLSNSHYDMNLVFIDAVFRHLHWTGDVAFAREAWPVIERHLAWERRLFRREFGPEKLPLYEAYAAIWASDDLQYSGGGAMHASAYNYYENRQAARLARWLGQDPSRYEQEADLLAKSMRALLWVSGEDPASATGAGGGSSSSTGVSVPSGQVRRAAAEAADTLGRKGWFAEYKDWLGLQRVHPSAALWTFYHTMDSDVPTSQEAWLMADYVRDVIPHLPVRGPDVPEGLCTLATSDWMPYDWSINNVVMAEAVHGALGLWQAGRIEEAFSVLKGSVVAAMFMGITPGNVGSMSYLDVYRRESQRDFADGSGVLSRAFVEGLFGVKPDALAGELRVTPGWPVQWQHASIRHPDFAMEYLHDGADDRYRIVQHRRSSTASAKGPAGELAPLAVRLQLVARRDEIGAVRVNGRAASWHQVPDAVGWPRIEILAPAAAQIEIVVTWAGNALRTPPRNHDGDGFAATSQGAMRWLQPPPRTPRKPDEGTRYPAAVNRTPAEAGTHYDPVDLSAVFNDRITELFKHEYRAPRSPFVSLALPKQGLGGWAGGVNRTAEIDDAGLRAASRRGGGRIVLPDGIPLATPAEADSRNVVFTSQWDNYPRQAEVALEGVGQDLILLVAGTTNPMQSRFENGELIVNYADGTSAKLALINPETWWPIEQDYMVDDFQFRFGARPPLRIELKTGEIRDLGQASSPPRGRMVRGGAATVLRMSLDPSRRLKSLVIKATANDVIVGLLAATIVRQASAHP